MSSLLFESSSETRLWVRLDFGSSGCLLLQPCWDRGPIELCAVRLCANRGRQTSPPPSEHVNRMYIITNCTYSMSFACLIDSLGLHVINVIICVFIFLFPHLDVLRSQIKTLAVIILLMT